MKSSFFNAHLLHQNPDNKKTDETDVCHVSHNFLNFKTSISCHKGDINKMLLFDDAILES